MCSCRSLLLGLLWLCSNQSSLRARTKGRLPQHKCSWTRLPLSPIVAAFKSILYQLGVATVPTVACVHYKQPRVFIGNSWERPCSSDAQKEPCCCISAAVLWFSRVVICSRTKSNSYSSHIPRTWFSNAHMHTSTCAIPCAPLCALPCCDTHSWGSSKRTIKHPSWFKWNKYAHLCALPFIESKDRVCFLCKFLLFLQQQWSSGSRVASRAEGQRLIVEQDRGAPRLIRSVVGPTWLSLALFRVPVWCEDEVLDRESAIKC